MTPRTDQPIAGFYRRRLVKGGPWVPVLIAYGAPLDPVTGEELDRSPRWQAWSGGREIDVWNLWPDCSGEPITKAEYTHLRDVGEWAERHAPRSPEANPTRAISLNQMPTIF
jgi:hypothetical protein